MADAVCPSMTTLSDALRIRLEQLMWEIASALTVDAFIKCREKAKTLKHDIAQHYEDQS